MSEETHVTQRRALGKGLSALIPHDTTIGTGSGSRTGSGGHEIEVSQLRPNRVQPRQRFDAKGLEELIESVRANGILQPLLIQKVKDEEGYEVIAGERRLRAARAAGLSHVPCIIKEVDGDQRRLQLSLIENIHRRDLNAIELGSAYKKLQDEFNLSQAEVAEIVGQDRSTVANLTRLLQLPEDLQTAVTTGALSMGHARALLACDSASEQRRIARLVLEEGLTVRQVEDMTQGRVSEDESFSETVPKASAAAGPADPNIRGLEQTLQQSLGTKVMLKPKANGKGRIIIEYYSAEDCDRLIQFLTAGQNE
ncbi:MAG: ParB/RepB/Spo0J family partition protein [Candidatus Omnitrophica bacterium]|nr:ParB/RepB/Spo0J family partition protein [Candidatus Omnitrophota bacterium]